VHTLKSNAGQLNKTSLQHAAEEIENSLKDGENLITPNQMMTLETELNIAISELAPLVSEKAMSAEGAVLLDCEAACKLLEKLEYMLIDSDPECLSYINDLRLVSGSEKLIRQMENFDFKPAAKSLAELMKRQRGD